MPEDHEFAREDVYPSWMANAIQRYLSGLRNEFKLSLKSSTEVEVAPAEPLGVSSMCIQGRWRYIEAAVNRAHPGGAKGTYDIWAVAEDNDIVNSPKPFTDLTNYAFSLRITPHGTEPSGSGVVIFEKVGELEWSGTAITSLWQLASTVSGAMIASGALSNSGSLNWERDPTGAWVPTLKSGIVGTTQLAEAAITAAKIAAGAVVEAAVASGAISTAKIQNAAITAALLAAESVTGTALAPSAVSAAKIAAEAVTTAKLAFRSVTAEKIGLEAVETTLLKNLAVTAAKIAAEAVTTEKIANLAVTTAKVAELAITEVKIADGAVTSRKLKLTSGMVSASGSDLTLTTSFQDIPGTPLELTPAVASYLYVFAIFNLGIDANGHVGASVNGALNVDGVNQEDEASIGQGGSTTIWISETLPAFYRVPLTAAKHTIKQRAKKGLSEQNGTAYILGTGYLWFLGSQ